MSLLALSLSEFLERLASSDPTPGGGSASALAAAQAAGLVAMVARLSQKTDVEGAGALAREIALRMDGLRGVLAALVEADAAAFEEVMLAYRLPRESDEEKAARRERIQAALVRATEVPLEVAVDGIEVMRAAAELAEVANPNAISDLGVASVLAAAGGEGALLNVAINLKGIKDAATADRLRSEAARAKREAESLRGRVLAAVRQKLEG